MKNQINTFFITVCLFLVSVGVAFADIRGNGNIIERLDTLKQFNTLRINGKFDVRLHYDPIDPHIVIKMDENLKDNVKVLQLSKILVITTKKRDIPTKLVLDVYTDNYQSILLEGALSLSCDTLLRENKLRLVVKGNCFGGLDVATENFLVDYKGNGKLQFTGRSSSSSFNVKGGGSIEAAKVVAGDLKTSVNGAGTIHVSVTDKFKASIEGSGIIRYEGIPHLLDVHVKGSGQVISIDRCQGNKAI